MGRATDTAIGRPMDGEYQSVSVGSTSAATTNAVTAQTYRVVLYSTTDCHIRFGQAPTATTSDAFLPASTQVMYSIAPGEKVAAIRSSEDGTLHVSEFTL